MFCMARSDWLKYTSSSTFERYPRKRDVFLYNQVDIYLTQVSYPG